MKELSEPGQHLSREQATHIFWHIVRIVFGAGLIGVATILFLSLLAEAAWGQSPRGWIAYSWSAGAGHRSIEYRLPPALTTVSLSRKPTAADSIM